MRFRNHTKDRRARIASGRHDRSGAVFVVSTARGVEQIFARSEDAERYVCDVPGATISTHLVRESVDDAVVIFDRRVLIADGRVTSDRVMQIRQFVDDPMLLPARADVEWFQVDRDDGWHIAGFGTDEAELSAKVAAAVDRAVGLSNAARAGAQ